MGIIYYFVLSIGITVIVIMILDFLCFSFPASATKKRQTKN